MKINLNQNIKVKLNDVGAKIYKDYWAPTDKICGTTTEVNQDDGYTVMQFWNFLQIFGPHTAMHLDCYLVDNEVIFDE